MFHYLIPQKLRFLENSFSIEYNATLQQMYQGDVEVGFCVHDHKKYTSDYHGPDEAFIRDNAIYIKHNESSMT